MQQFAPPATCDPFRTGAEYDLDAFSQSLAFAFLPLCTPDTRTVARSGSFTVTFTYGVPFLQGLTLYGQAPNALVDLTAQFTAIDLPAGATLTADSGTVYPLIPDSPTAILTSLAAFVQSLNLSNGISNSLDAKLQNAQQALDAARAGDVVSACNMVAAFVNQVEAQTGVSLTTAEAAQLAILAQNVRSALGCG